MNATLAIVIGGEVPDNYKNIPSILVRLPGESGKADGVRVIAPESLAECLLFFRRRFSHHSDIASLASTIIVDGHFLPNGQAAKIRPEWAEAIENKLCELLDDLGNCALDTMKGAVHFLHNLPVMEHAATSQDLVDFHHREVAVVVGSGPSASDRMADLRRIRSGVRIFCADSILGGLLANGITPDYVCAIEREESIGKLLEGHENCGATLICSPFLHHEIAKKWANNGCFWWSDDDICAWANSEITPISPGRSAGSLALAAALTSGVRVAYLVGHDLAYRNGKSHASDAHSLASEVAKSADQDAHAVNVLRQRVQVEANHGGFTESNGLWCRVRGDLEGIISNHPEQIVRNASGWDAAAVAGAMADDLPENPILLPKRVPLPRSFPILPHDVRGKIAEAAAVMAQKLEAIASRLDACNPHKAAADIQVSRMVPPEFVKLFHYLTRAIYSNMLLRLNYNFSLGVTSDDQHRKTLRLAIKAMAALLDRFQKAIA